MSASTAIGEPEVRTRSTAARFGSPTAVAWSVIFLSPLPQLLVHFRRLWGYEHYQYFPFVIAAFAYFTWRRWPTGDRGDMPKTELTLLGTGFLLLAVSTVVWSPWLATVSTIFTIGAALVRFAGRYAVAQLTSVWLLLWLLIPIPFGLDVQLIFELQSVASNGASYLLDFLGVNHLLAGHVLEVPGHTFLVEEACSGIQSLFALLAFAAILMIALRRSWFHSTALLATAIFWATSINVIRVTTVVVAFVWFDFDLATAWKHETLGLVLNGFAILMLVCTDQLVLFLLEPSERLADDHDDDFFMDDDDDDHDHDDPPDPGELMDDGTSVRTNQDAPTVDRPSRVRVSLTLAALFAVLGVGQVASLFLKVDAWRMAGEASERLDGAFQATTLPEQIGAWKQVSFESESRGMTSNLGAHFAAWNYLAKDATAIVHTDYPFQGWHDLPACFEAQGWQIKSLEMTPVALQSGPAAEVWRLELIQPSAAMHVRFCQFDAFGQTVRPTAGWWPTSWRKLLYHHPGTPWRFLASNASTYQVVMQVTTSRRDSEVPPEELTADFVTIRDHLLKTVVGRLHDDD